MIPLISILYQNLCRVCTVEKHAKKFCHALNVHNYDVKLLFGGSAFQKLAKNLLSAQK